MTYRLPLEIEPPRSAEGEPKKKFFTVFQLIIDQLNPAADERNLWPADNDLREARSVR